MDQLSPGTPGGTDGDWLAHFANNSTPVEATWDVTVADGGEYVLWVRSASYRVSAWAQIDGGALIDLDLDATARETLNLVYPGIDIRFLSWTRVGTVSLSSGAHQLTIGLEPHGAWGGSQIYGGVDAFVLVNDGRVPSGAAMPALEAATPAADDWFAFFPGDPPRDWADSVAAWPSSPISQRVVADGDRLILEDGSPVKLWGTNSHPPLRDDLIEQQAAMYAAMGINIVRLHSVFSLLGDPVDADALDRLDRWFAALKAHGIYTQWSVFYPFTIEAGDGYSLYSELPGGSTSGVVTVSAELQALEWEYLRALLDHENPYTKTTYAEDPALAVIEIRNEDSIFWHAPLNSLMSGALPLHEAALEADWRDWLIAAYGDDAGLAAAWGAGLRASDDLSGGGGLDGYAAWELSADGPLDPDEVARAGDWIRFLAQRQREGYEARLALLRDAGYDGLMITTAWKSGGAAAELANLWTDTAGDVIDRHTYWGGGAGGHQIATGEISTAALLDDPAASFLATSGPLPEGQPFLHSEWTAKPPNESRFEAAPLYALYGMGLHGWDGSLHFSASTSAWIDGGWPGLSSYVSETPHYMGQYFALSRAVREQHITEAPPAARLSISDAALFGGTDARPELDARLAALGPVVVAFEDGGSDTVIDADTYDDGTYLTSEELSWKPGAHMRIAAASTQGIVGTDLAGTHALPDVSIDLTSEQGSLLLTALDGAPLSESAAVLVTAMGRDIQTGAAYSADRGSLEAVGGPPLLLEPIQARLTFGRTPLSVSALDVYGVPQRELTDALDGDTVEIDGRWQTAWYLVTFEAPPEDTGAGPHDSDEPNNGDDTDSSAASPSEQDAPSGCGCSGVGLGGGGWLMVAAALAATRRRRHR